MRSPRWIPRADCLVRSAFSPGFGRGVARGAGWLALVLVTLATAGPAPSGEPKPPPERTLFVPMDELPKILGGKNERVFMDRAQYEELRRKAHQTPPSKAPVTVSLAQADYQVTIEQSLALIRGVLIVDVLEPGWHMLPLELNGARLVRANLAGEPAPVARDAGGQVVLFVEGVGRHALELELQSLVTIAAAQQSLQFQLPPGAGTSLKVDIPGNVEVKSGPGVVARQYDAPADRTRLELIAGREPVALVMSLNNRLLRQQRVVTARSVLVSELTTTYERLHASVTLDVLHGAADHFLFDVPKEFQITSVASPRMAQWVVRQEAGRDVLEVVLREPARDSVELNVAATRAPVTIGQWTMPQLRPQQVVGDVAVVGLLAESRLQPLDFTATNLIRIDTEVLRKALPASVWEVEPGAPEIRPLAAYYAPAGTYSLTAKLDEPTDLLRVATHLLLVLGEQQQTLRGGFTLTAQGAKQSGFAFQMPESWVLQRVYAAENQPVPYEPFEADQARRYVVRLPAGIEPGQSQTVYFEATRSDAAWLDDWTLTDVEFPAVRVEQARVTSGAIAVQADGDLEVRPAASMPGLRPLDSSRRSQFGMDTSDADLTYEVVEDTFQARFQVTRTRPRLSCRNYAFLQIRPGELAAHYELFFVLERARARVLRFALPEDTPAAVAIRGLDGLELKESSAAVADGRRIWTVLLAEAQLGTVHLAVDFQQRLEDGQQVTFDLPMVEALDVAYQTHMVAVEGDPALDIQIDTEMRPVDVGELVEANYMPGRRLLGAYASTAGTGAVRVELVRRDLRPLPAAIVQRAELVTLISTSGLAQSSARYQLRTKVPLLAVHLPDGAEFWSAVLNGKPIRPQRRGDQILISLQTENANPVRDLQIVYQCPVSPLGWVGQLATTAPQLWLAADPDDPGTPVPQVDLVWHVHFPSGYRLSRVAGTVSSEEAVRPRLPLVRLARVTVGLGGGVQQPMMAARDHARVAAQTKSDLAEGAAVEARGFAFRSPATPPPPGIAAGRRQFGLAVPTDEAPQESRAEKSDADRSAFAEPAQPDMNGVADPFGAAPPNAAGDVLKSEAGNGDASRPAAGGQPMNGQAGQAGMPGASGGQMGYGMESGVGGGMGGMGGAMGPSGGRPRGGGSDGAGMQPGGDTGMGMGMPGGQLRPQTRAGERSGRGTDSATAAQSQSGPAQRAEQVSNEPAEASAKIRKYWALQGLRGLNIDIDSSGPGVTFRSLGHAPALHATVFNQRRMDWLGWAVATLIVAIGLRFRHAPVAQRIRWLAFLVLLVCGLTTIGGPVSEYFGVLEKSLVAAIVLVPLWVLVAFGGQLARWLGRVALRIGPVAGSALILCAAWSALGTGTLQAQSIADLIKQLDNLDPPAVIPDDALVVPYDPADPASRTRYERVLVPYGQYTELWKLAHPEQPAGLPAGAPSFAVAGGAYQVALSDLEYLEVTGTLDIVLFDDTPVDVPLALAGGVITSAQLDQQPARLKAVGVPPAAANQAAAQGPAQQQVAQVQLPQRVEPGMAVTVLVTGRGPHRLELTVRAAVTRQGGWRRVAATIPYAEATEVSVSVPQAGTQITRWLGGTSFNQVTDRDTQTLDLPLEPGGRFQLAWRPRLTSEVVDQGLTAECLAVVDLGEDGVHASWQIRFEFGQTERGTLHVAVPADYLVEKVEGKNVRGWDQVAAAAEAAAPLTVLKIELLKAVKQTEQVVIQLARRTTLAGDQPVTLDVPLVQVPDAALQRGVVRIRRSAMLDVRTVATTGAARDDNQTTDQEMQPLLVCASSPLAIRDYQTYRFRTLPFRVAVEVEQIGRQVSAELRTLVRIGETEAGLESELRITSDRRPWYELHVAVPAGLELKEVLAAGLSDWSVVTEGERQVLTAFFSTGQTGLTTLTIRGPLRAHEPNSLLDLPQFEVLTVDRQQGVMVMQADTALDVTPADLVGLQPTLLDRVRDWLAPAQRAAARLALAYSRVPYQGRLQLAPRAPRISCDSISNVRLTYRDIQETILLDFQITQAGARQLVFQLPATLKDGAITARMIRQKTVEPIAGTDRVRVTLDLQDAVIGEYRVMVENDRALSAGPQSAPLPVIETGTTDYRYVTLENAGRDEVVVDEDRVVGMQPVQRQSRPWQRLTARLQGADFTTAYVTTDAGAEIRFGFATKRREVVKTAGANIGLARTELVLDESGTYRAATVLKVDNRTEPYLEIELPEGAELWAAHVAERPVKPARALQAASNRVLRIPLVKTAEGDLDYAVVLKYGGQVDPLRTLRTVAFPIIKTINVHVELSQVKLYVPDAYRWIQFDGNAARVTGEDDFLAGYVAYRTRQVESLTRVLRGKNVFSASRALQNVKSLQTEFESLERKGVRRRYNEELRQNMDLNDQALEAAQQEIAQVQRQAEESVDNRRRLNSLFGSQATQLSRNTVLRMESNFSAPTGGPEEAGAKGADEHFQFDSKWFARPTQPGKPETAAETPAESEPADAEKDVMSRLGRAEGRNLQDRDNQPAAQEAAQNVFQVQPNAKGQTPQNRFQQLDDRRLATENQLKQAYSDKLQLRAAQTQTMEGVTTGPQVPSGLSTIVEPQVDELAPDGESAESTVGLGLTSLDFTLPERGSAFYFTTPRGEVDIYARPVSEESMDRLTSLACLIVAAILFWVILAIVRRFPRSARALTIVAVCTALLGLLMVFGMILPLYGMVLLAAAALLATEAFQARRGRQAT